MNQVDLADQLRMWYRPDGLWIRQKKWWWNIFIWCMGQAVVNAYVLYKAVCEEEKKKPMTHLAFHVAVATAWCKTPKIVLEYEMPTRAEARAAAEAAEPEQGGVHGERQSARRSAGDTPAPTPRKKGVRSRSKSPASSPRGQKNDMTDAKHEAAKKSYAESPELHCVEIPTLSPKKNVSNCQLCGTGRGMRKPGMRFQISAHLHCKQCNVNVCGGGCWQLLHGYYSNAPGEGEVLPASAPRGKAAKSKTVDEESGEEADDEGEGEGEEEVL